MRFTCVSYLRCTSHSCAASWLPIARSSSGAAKAPDEYLGQPLTASFRDTLAAIDLGATEPLADRVSVIRTRVTPELQRLESAWQGRPGVSFVDVPAADNWNSDAALNAAAVCRRYHARNYELHRGTNS